ncbi:hypothetical protein BDN70DRAFT_691635 [Pholiota conissans]|uniref:LysM domain-containing protein n=1 Tax=Pholiota conissans TaxID=109636 RepID=A0A9P5Z1H2_9AGAR|nr:hypothetical protein BDN70DRAFT_691635 [Pholiota conissans]
MGRWTQYDEDDYRLPEGMKRIGYDADSGRYYFRDTDGSLWKGPQGAEFGQMTRVNELPATVQAEVEHSERHGGHNDDLEASPRASRDGYQVLSESDRDEHSRPMAHQVHNHSSYRSLFPFFLIIAVCLLLVWRLLVQPSLSSPAITPKRCPEGTAAYWIQPGQSCWEVSRERGWSLAEFHEANPKVNCEPLLPGTSVCLPPKPSAGGVNTLKNRKRGGAQRRAPRR